jgi:putative ABC transport system permease protein
VRSALGATPGDIMALVMKQGAVITLAGLTIGFGAAAATLRYLSQYLFGVAPLDAKTFAVAGILLAALALAACAVPARRAARIDAIDALRH